MKNKSLLLAMLLIVNGQANGDTPVDKTKNPQNAAVMKSQDRIDTQQQIAGNFQRYDQNRKIVRISDVEYDLDPSLVKFANKLNDLRSGQTVLFTQSGVSQAGRNVLTSIASQ